MLKGYTHPRTPKGKSNLVPTPPWHFVGNCLAVEYEAAPAAIRDFLPDGLEYYSPQSAVYFIEWQYAGEAGEEYLDPVRSQYRETILLISAKYQDNPCSYCPFIWVDQDVSLMRGLVQGWPKQIGSTWITRAYDLPSPATPVLGTGGMFGATLSAKERRLMEAVVTLQEQTNQLPNPNFARTVLTRFFPNLVAGKHEQPAVYELVQLKSRDVRISPIWKGEAVLRFMDHPYLELPDLQPVKVLAGYRFTCALTVDEIIFLQDLQNSLNPIPAKYKIEGMID